MHVGKTVAFDLCLKLVISEKKKKRSILFSRKKGGFKSLPPGFVRTYQF